jgi:hypothetical protein
VLLIIVLVTILFSIYEYQDTLTVVDTPFFFAIFSQFERENLGAIDLNASK